MAELAQAIPCVLVALLYASAGIASEGTSPEVDAVESVRLVKEAQDMKSSPITDFDEESEPWRTINDGVMGGLSSSSFAVEEGVARFEGTVSLENNGGFASVRSRPQDHDLSPFRGILLRVRGDGKRYAFRLRTSSAFDGVSYQVFFKTVPDQWITVLIPFEAFQPVFRGRLVRGAEPLDLKSVKTFGFLISDKQAGPFRLEVDWIKAYPVAQEGNVR